MPRAEDVPGAGRSLPSTGGGHLADGVGDDRTDVRGRPHCMGGGGRLCWSLLLPGPAQPSTLFPHPHLPLPAHHGEEGMQRCGERVFLRGHAFGGRREALAPP